MPNNHSEIEKRLWASADELRANSKLKSSEYCAFTEGGPPCKRLSNCCLPVPGIDEKITEI